MLIHAYYLSYGHEPQHYATMIQETSLNFEDPIAPKCINQQYAERRKRRQKNKAHQYVAAMAIPGKHDDDISMRMCVLCLYLLTL